MLVKSPRVGNICSSSRYPFLSFFNTRDCDLAWSCFTCMHYIILDKTGLRCAVSDLVFRPHHYCMAVVLDMGSTDLLGGPWTDFRGSVNFDWEKVTTLFAQTCNWNAAFHSVMIAGDKGIYDLYIPNFFVNFNISHYLYFMHLNRFLWSGVRRFRQALNAGPCYCIKPLLKGLQEDTPG